MHGSTGRWLASLALPALLSLAGCPPPEHRDEGDDDTVPGDDDSAEPGDDDDTVPGDDDTTGDDDDMILYGARSDDDSAPRHPDLLRRLRV